MDSLMEPPQREKAHTHLSSMLQELFLYFGKSKVDITLSKEAEGFHYLEKDEFGEMSGDSDKLPLKLRRFWTE